MPASSEAAEEVQTLLRFLTQDAKVPLAIAMSKVHALRKANFSKPESISKTSLPAIEEIFTDAKVAKQVFNAAKRVSNPKKRPADASESISGKRLKATNGEKTDSPVEREKALAFPTLDDPETNLTNIRVETNRAPLVLAFAVILLSYTRPHQPLSSRLSLAQAIVSANSRSKAQSIGLESGPSAEEEGFGQGQPKVKIMGREIPVMRRDGYLASLKETKAAENSNDSEITSAEGRGEQEALWGLDLEALRKSKSASSPAGNHLPIYTAEAARNYLLKSFKPVTEEPESPVDSQATITASLSPKKPKKKKPAELTHEREQVLASLLTCLDRLFKSWAPTLGIDELDRRAWQWYLHVRPDVRAGEAGWGQRGSVKLGDILALRKDAG
ncbi:MAG: hypothetical protein Q9160_009177 [Pyrenula sp. 1 TL-2023]